MSTCRKESFGRSSSGIAALRCALALLLGAPLLGGCAASHVGSAWQCPMLEGQPCVSVAGADPAGGSAPDRNAVAGPDTAVVNAPVSETPLYRTSSATDRETHDTGAQRSRTACRGGCRPFAWLRRVGRHGTAAPPDEGAAEAANGNGDIVQTVAVQAPEADDLRTPEAIGRIWIAPWVDAHGVYHEASWVRVVFEPAGWKHP